MIIPWQVSTSSEFICSAFQGCIQGYTPLASTLSCPILDGPKMVGRSPLICQPTEVNLKFTWHKGPAPVCLKIYTDVSLGTIPPPTSYNEFAILFVFIYQSNLLYTFVLFIVSRVCVCNAKVLHFLFFLIIYPHFETRSKRGGMTRCWLGVEYCKILGVHAAR